MFTISTGIKQSSLTAGIRGHIIHVDVRNSKVAVNLGSNFDNGIFVRRENKKSLWRASNF